MSTYRKVKEVNMKKSHRRVPRGVRGQAIVIIALAMVALMAFMVLAIDGGKYYDQRRTAQNASDMASQAGLYTKTTKTGVTDNDVLTEIYRVAALNGISSPSTNVTAFWIKSDGTYTDGTVTYAANTEPPPSQAQITSAGSIPSNAQGIKVRSLIPYTTFIGQMVGQKNTQAQADGVAMRLLTIPPVGSNVDPKTSVFLGGGDPSCNTTLDIASTGNGNSLSLGDPSGNAYIVGNSALGSGESNQGLFKASKSDSSDTAYFTGSSNGVDAGGGTINSSTTGTKWVDPYTTPFPTFFYITLTDGTKHLITADDFRPTTDYDSTSPWVAGTGSGQYSDNYLIEQYIQAGKPDDGTSPVTHYFHWVASTTDAVANGAALKTAMDSGGPGIYFVDGPVTMSVASSNFLISENATDTGYGLVATGKVLVDAGNGNSLLAHANVADGWGKGLSILSGYVASSDGQCPSSGHFDPAVTTSSQQIRWGGTVYTPYAAVSFSSNSNSKPNGPVIARGFSIGDGGNSNSQTFGLCADCWSNIPTYTYGLNQ